MRKITEQSTAHHAQKSAAGPRKVRAANDLHHMAKVAKRRAEKAARENYRKAIGLPAKTSN